MHLSLLFVSLHLNSNAFCLHLCTCMCMLECPKCPEVKGKIKLAMNSFWSGDLYTAYGCSCSYLVDKPNDGLAQVREILLLDNCFLILI